ncbi:MAG: hypothetical protein Tsb002_28900 [Wenzhouxiangellaceae bacterium]
MRRWRQLAWLLLITAAPLSALAGGRIALTFDDAPRPDQACLDGATRAALLRAQLRQHSDAPALFLVTTGHINSDNRQRLLDYTSDGHQLGNHSHQHRHPQDLGAADYLADIERAEQQLSDFPKRLPLYRFPFLNEGRDPAMRDALRAGLQRLGLRNAYVTVDNYDWYMDALLQRALADGRAIDIDRLGDIYSAEMMDSILFYDSIARRHLGRSPAHVLLLHENDLAALFLDRLIARLHAEGWSLIGAEEAYADAIASQIPETLFNGQGRVAALAHVQGVTPRQLVPENEEEDYLQQRFDSGGVYLPAESALAAGQANDCRAYAAERLAALKRADGQTQRSNGAALK